MKKNVPMTVLLLGGILFALLGIWSHIIRTGDIVHGSLVVRMSGRPFLPTVHSSLIPDELRFFQPISISLFEFHFSLSE